jgi:hypothetical protein
VGMVWGWCSFRGDQYARPRWATRLGMLAWLLDMANFENVPVRLHGFEMKDSKMFFSVFTRNVFKEIQVPHVLPEEATP